MTRDDGSRELATAGRRRSGKGKRTKGVGRTGARFPAIHDEEPDDTDDTPGTADPEAAHTSPPGPAPAPSSPAASTSAVSTSSASLGHPAPGHAASGHAMPGHPSSGHPTSAHPTSGHPTSGHSASAYSASGHSAPGQPAEYPTSGHHTLGQPTSEQPVPGHPAAERSSADRHASGQPDSTYLAARHSAVAHPSEWPSAEAPSTYPSAPAAYGPPVADSPAGHSPDRGSVADEVVGAGPGGGVDDVEVVGRTGARFGPYSVRKSRRAKEFDTGSTPVVEEPVAGTPPGEPTPEQSAERTMPLIKPWAGALVRPYAHTGGRTRSSHTLELEALVSSSWHPGIGDAVLTTHHRRMIVDLCVQPRSVAEVAALLSVPLGVVRVLLGDLASAGVVVVHPTAGTSGDGAPDLAFMQRVLVGLRRL